MRRCPKVAPKRNGLKSRHGSVLLLVLLVLAALAFGVYAFSSQMLLEYQGLQLSLEDVRALEAAKSGVQLSGAQVERRDRLHKTICDHRNSGDHSWLDTAGNPMHVRIVAGPVGSPHGQMLGLLDECSKFNLNSLSLVKEDEVESRQRLMVFPGMTPIVADSILDWMDPDEDRREYGAESDWYLANGFQYVPRQGPFKELKELLLVRDVELARLFGLDGNADGWLQDDEIEIVAGKTVRQAPQVIDNAFGWSQWLTTYSAESNLNDQGAEKVCVNDSALHELYLAVEPIIGVEGARFIVAIRMNGPIPENDTARFDSEIGIGERKRSATQRAKEQASESLRIHEVKPVVVKGFAIQRAPTYTIESLVDLIDRRVEATVNGQDEILHSPWGDIGNSVSEQLTWLEERLSTKSGVSTAGRINIQSAAQEVLLSIPGISESAILQIVRSQSKNSFDDRRSVDCIGWLVDQKILTLSELRSIAPFITCGGDVFSGTAIGSGAIDGREQAISFLLDATGRRINVHFAIQRGVVSSHWGYGESK